jgi:hypothetical protein
LEGFFLKQSRSPREIGSFLSRWFDCAQFPADASGTLIIEKDPKKVRKLAEKKENENWDFRAWLKFHAPDDIDEIVAGLSRKYFSLIDCKECGNCCRSLSAMDVSESELATMAETKRKLEVSRADGKCSVKMQPCPMLDGNLCSIYANRPKTCRDYPYLELPDFTYRLIGVIENTFICPIVFNVFEELKLKLGWRKRHKLRA